MSKIILSISILTIIIILSNCSKKPEDEYSRVTYEVEFDHQVSADIIAAAGQGAFENKVGNAFDRAEDGARTFVSLRADDASFNNRALPDEIIPYDEIGLYTATHRRLNGSTPEIPGYLVLLKDVSNQPNPNENGYSVVGPSGWSILVWDKCGSTEERIKVIIHELGHQRTSLTHLCEYPGNHNRDDCVMGQGIIASCTGENLVNNPRFCNTCELKIRTITW